MGRPPSLGDPAAAVGMGQIPPARERGMLSGAAASQPHVLPARVTTCRREESGRGSGESRPLGLSHPPGRAHGQPVGRDTVGRTRPDLAAGQRIYRSVVRLQRAEAVRVVVVAELPVCLRDFDAPESLR